MTVVPFGGNVADLAQLKGFAKQALSARRLRLIIDDREPVDVPAAVSEALMEILSILSRGRPVMIAAQNTELTTGEAAELLGLSRPTVVKLMEDGVLPYSRPSSSRRVALQDVLAYKELRSNARRSALDTVTADAVDSGVYRPAAVQPE